MPVKEKKLLQTAEEQPRKEPYAAPKLTVHGDVDEITQMLEVGEEDTPMGGGSRIPG